MGAGAAVVTVVVLAAAVVVVAGSAVTRGVGAGRVVGPGFNQAPAAVAPASTTTMIVRGTKRTNVR